MCRRISAINQSCLRVDRRGQPERLQTCTAVSVSTTDMEGSPKRLRATSTIEYQIWRHGRGVVIGAIEQHDTAEQDDRQQAVWKPGRPAEPTGVHLFVSLLANRPFTSPPLNVAIAPKAILGGSGSAPHLARLRVFSWRAPWFLDRNVFTAADAAVRVS